MNFIADMRGFLVLVLGMAATGCAALTGSESASRPGPSPPSEASRQLPGAGQAVDPAAAERLKRLMLPLLRVMDHPIKAGEAKVSIVDDQQLNAGSAGSGQFVVTSGLLKGASDEQLQAVMAHEVAHDDLGHVAKAQRVGAGLNIATVILDQVFPGSGQFTPLAGDLLIRAYSRKEEYEADRHGVDLLRRLNPAHGKDMMINALTWLQQKSGSGGGGFFATHPGTGDRIETLRRLP